MSIACQPVSPLLYPRWAANGPYDPESLCGTRAAGIRYELAVGKLLQTKADELGWNLRNHPWIETPSRWLQPDFVLEAPSGKGIVFECKLTWVDAWSQIQRYKIALKLLGLPCVGALVCKNLTPDTPKFIRQFEDITNDCIWHLHQ
jgi:hypothetical protein